MAKLQAPRTSKTKNITGGHKTQTKFRQIVPNTWWKVKTSSQWASFLTAKKRGPNAYLAPTHYFLSRILKWAAIKDWGKWRERRKWWWESERQKLYNAVWCWVRDYKNTWQLGLDWFWWGPLRELCIEEKFGLSPFSLLCSSNHHQSHHSPPSQFSHLSLSLSSLFALSLTFLPQKPLLCSCSL